MATRTPMVGAPLKRVEDPRLITGKGRFTDDVALDGMTYMAVLRSPHASARILRIETSAAAEAPGVLAVTTGPDVRPHCSDQLPLLGVREGMNVRSRWPVALDLVRYVGEPVAAVVASSRATARDALDLIEVTYEPLPAVVDVEMAAEDGSQLVHEDMGTNICVDLRGEAGDPDAAFRGAAGVVKLRLEEPRVAVSPIEPRAVVACYDSSTERLTLWDTTQAPHLERTDVCQVLDLPEDRVRIIAFDVGGGFGCKHPTYPESYLAAVLAMQLGRPVRWTEEREEHFISTAHGRGQVQHAEAAYSGDGILLGLRVSYYTDLGAYSHASSHASATVTTSVMSTGMYRLENLSWAAFGVYTNKIPRGPYRGYGKAEPIFMLERVMDEIARALDMDPAEVRRRNYVRVDEFPYTTATGLKFDSGDYNTALNLALDLAGYKELRHEQERLRAQGVLMGIGVASNVELSSFGPTSSRLGSFPGSEAATVKIGPDGGVTVFTGSAPHGQGHETTFSQIVADELGVPIDSVELIWGDTSVTPSGGMGTGGTRSLVVAGTAIIQACRRLVEKAVEVAAPALGARGDLVLLEDGRFRRRDGTGRQLSWTDVVTEAVQAEETGPDGYLEASDRWEPDNYTFPYAVHIAVVRVDPETGDVSLVKHVCVDDCGTVVNPLIVDGQVHGGLAQGIGEALIEVLQWDENGQLLTGSFMDYAMPLAEEFPHFELGRTVTPSPSNPLGAKGAGETGSLSATPAVANAVIDALSHAEAASLGIPLTSEKVWSFLREVGRAG